MLLPPASAGKLAARHCVGGSAGRQPRKLVVDGAQAGFVRHYVAQHVPASSMHSGRSLWNMSSRR